MQKKNTPKGKKSSTKTQPTTTAGSRKVQGSTNNLKRKAEKMSRNLATATRAKHSTKRGTLALLKTDPLAKYKAQAATLIRIMFDENDDTPDFVRDEVQELLTELENETQVFWNTREIAEVAIPLMLKAADDYGIDWQSPRSAFVSEALGSMYGIERRNDEGSSVLSEHRRLNADLEADAEAIARIINSPHTPSIVVEKLTDAINMLVYNGEIKTFRRQMQYEPDVLRAAYPLAVQQLKEDTPE